MKRTRGFTLVEVVVTIAIVAILLSIGASSWQTYLNNTRLRAAAQSFLSGIQAARAEAVRRNTNIDFVLTNAATLDTTSAAAVDGLGWIVRTSDGVTFVEGKSFAEGTGGIAVNSAGASTITFTGLGTTTQAANLTLSFSNPAGGNCLGATPAGPMRCLDIVVTRGGQSKLCDPTVVAPDTRSC